MIEPEITRDRYPEQPDKIADLAIRSWQQYRAIQMDVQQIENRTRQNHDRTAIALKRKIRDALEFQRGETDACLQTFVQLSPAAREQIDDKRLSECVYITQHWEREQELELISFQPSKERDHDRSR